MEFARIVANDAFYFLLSVISSSGASGVSIGKTRHERPEKYSYSNIDIEDEELSKLLWELHSISQEEMLTCSQLSRARRQVKVGKFTSKTNKVMLHIGTTASCSSYK